MSKRSLSNEDVVRLINQGLSEDLDDSEIQEMESWIDLEIDDTLSEQYLTGYDIGREYWEEGINEDEAYILSDPFENYQLNSSSIGSSLGSRIKYKPQISSVNDVMDLCDAIEEHRYREWDPSGFYKDMKYLAYLAIVECKSLTDEVMDHKDVVVNYGKQLKSTILYNDLVNKKERAHEYIKYQDGFRDGYNENKRDYDQIFTKEHEEKHQDDELPKDEKVIFDTELLNDVIENEIINDDGVIVDEESL